MTQLRAKARFLGMMCATFLASLAAVAAFNLAIDPYAIFGAPIVEGVNAVKPRPDAWIADIKLAVARKRGPKALILGNSRAEIGFDPDSAALRATKIAAYNMAVPGFGLAG